MISFSDSKIQFDFNRCCQCGACLAVCPTYALSASRRSDGLANIAVDYEKCITCKRCFRVCPANKPQDFSGYFGSLENLDFSLGYNKDNVLRAKSSSGGVAKTLIVESLKSGLVDGVYTLRRLHEYPGAEGHFFTADDIPGFDDIPNSVYHSVMQCLELAKIKKCRRLMVVGTACQLRALESSLKGKFESIIKVCIFCKQQKTLSSTRFLAKIAGSKIPADLKFTSSYRGGGWPGNVTIQDKSVPWHRAAQIPFGRRLWTVPGCNSCGDPFGFLAGADISLMDPWNIRSHNDLGETLTIANTEAGRKLIRSVEAVSRQNLTFEEACPALGISDIKRKQALVPYFRGQQTSRRIALAARAEMAQRKVLAAVVEILPRMPMIFYRALCKLPDMRNIILGKKL